MPTVSASRPVRSGSRSANWILAIVVITQLMIVLDASVVNLALTPLREDLRISATGIAWIPNAYVLAFGGLLLLGGRLGDVLGRRRTFLVGLTLFTVASLVGGVVSHEALLIAARTLQGVGAALTAPSALAILLARFPEDEGRNRALGLYAAMSAAGGAVGLLVGGALTWLSWRGVFFVNVPIGIAIVLLSLRLLPGLPGRPSRFDVAGALTGTIGVTALVLGFIRAGENGWGDAVAVASLAVAVVLLLLFVAPWGSPSWPRSSAAPPTAAATATASRTRSSPARRSRRAAC